MRPHAVPTILALLAVVAPSPARAEVDKNAAALITELVTTSLGKEARFDVLSSGDVRRQLEVEANRAVLGCDATSTSCLAEIAGAMGAQLVVYGKLGTLDDVVILTLNLFDSASARAVGRVAVKEKSLAALGDRVEPAVLELIAPFTAKMAADGKMKLLVLDLEPPEPPALPEAAAAAPAEPMSALFWSGIGGLAGGAVVGGIGVVLLVLAEQKNVNAKDPEVDAIAADGLYDERDALGGPALASLALGIGVIATGGVLLGLSFTE